MSSKDGKIILKYSKNTKNMEYDHQPGESPSKNSCIRQALMAPIMV